MSWVGYGAARRLLTALKCIEGTVQIQNMCKHLHYFVLEDFQYFAGNVSGLGHGELLNIRLQNSALFCCCCMHKLWERLSCNLLDSVRGLSSGGLKD